MIDNDHNSHQIQIALTHRQLSFLIAGVLALAFFIFISGYFLGKQRAAQEFSYKADQESLADQIYSSMCVLYDAKDENEDAEELDQESEMCQSSEIALTDEPKIEIEQKSEKKFTAALAGFSAKNIDEGKKMVSRLEKRGYGVELQERISKTAKDTKISWYQVTLKPVANKQELQQIINQIAKAEHLNAASIRVQELA